MCAALYEQYMYMPLQESLLFSVIFGSILELSQ